MTDKDAPPVEWSVFDGSPPNEIECACGAIFHSHSKHVNWNGKFVGVTRQPCPACGRTYGHIRRASTPPEKWTI